MKWTPVSIHEVVAEFLKSERDTAAGFIQSAMTSIIDNPDLTNSLQNHLRLKLLFIIRRWIVGEIPLDTIWYEVQNLTDQELNELHVIARCGWDDPGDRNELRKVAMRKPEKLISGPIDWRRPVLWGHSKDGPFTIIEGNHRLIAYASNSSTSGLKISALVGLSPTPCTYHIHDPADVIARDLWK